MSTPNSDKHINLVERLESLDLGDNPLTVTLKGDDALRDAVDAVVNSPDTAFALSPLLAAIATRVDLNIGLAMVANHELRSVILAVTHTAIAFGFVAARGSEVPA